MIEESDFHLFKVIVFGDPAVGKTSLVRRWNQGTFTENYKATIGVDFSTVEVKYEYKRIMLQLWDIAGQDRNQILIRAFVKRAGGIIFVYDVQRQQTLESFSEWYKTFLGVADNEKIPVILVGNKKDLLGGNLPSNHPINEILSRYQKEVILASAKTGEGCNEALLKIVSSLYIERDTLSIREPGLYEAADGGKPEKKEGGCC